MAGGLYIIWLSDTHYYGGRARNFQRRWSVHLSTLRAGSHRNGRVQAVFDRYGRFEPAVVQEIIGVAEMIAAEQAWLDRHIGQPGCLNIDASADGPFGRVPSPETRAKISATLTGRPHDSLRRLRNSMAQKGRKLSFATRQKISAAHRGKRLSAEVRARMKAAACTRKKRVFVPSSRKGASLSAEMRTKMAVGQQRRRCREKAAGLCHPNRGRVWVSHPEAGSKLVAAADVESHLNHGWVRGRTHKG